MMDIHYQNSKGEQINLLSDEFSLQTGDFFSFSWAYSDNGKKINGFQKEIEEKSLLLSVRGSSRAACYENMNHFMNVLEHDVLSLSPGKLFVGDYYMNCYLYAGEVSDWEDDIGCIDCEAAIISDRPIWIRETAYSFKPEETYSGNSKRYPNRYPHRYTNGLTGSYIINPHFNVTRFRMIIYGPVVNPLVIIGGNRYRANTLLESGEYLEIDGIAGTVRKIMNSGEIVNAFHFRDKDNNIFEPILPGRQSVEWTGKFAFDLILYEERSEPLWQ